MYQGVIDSVYTPWYTRQAEDQQLINKVTNIRNTLVDYLNTTPLSDTTFYALEYLVYLIDQDRNSYIPPAPVVETIVTTQELVVTTEDTHQTEQDNDMSDTLIENTPTPETSSINISSYTEGDKNILWGTQTWPVLKFELLAQHEWMIIDDINLKSSSNDFGRAINMVHLYDEQWASIASNSASQDSSRFLNLGREIPIWQTDVYIGFDVSPIWRNKSAPATLTMDFTLEIEDAYGIVSGNDQSTSMMNDDTITTVATQITDVQIADHYENLDVDNILWSNKTNLAILVISTWDGSWNTDTTNGSALQTIIESVTVVVDDNTQAQNIASNLEFARLNSGWFVSGTVNSNGTVTFDVSNLGTDAWIRHSDTEAFVISGTPVLDNATPNESVRISLVDLDYGGVIYRTTDPDSDPVINLALENRFVSGMHVEE